MVTPFARGRGLDARAAPAAWRGTWSRTARTGSWSPGTTGESPTLTDDEKLTPARGRARGGRRPRDGDPAAPAPTTPATRSSSPRSPPRPAPTRVLVVTPYYNKPNRRRACAPTSRRSPMRRAAQVVLYNIPSRCVAQPLARPARRAGAEIDERRRRQAGEQRRARARSRASTCWPATTRSSAARWSSGAPAGSSSPRIWSATQMREIYDAARGGRPRPRARDRRRAAARLRGDHVTANPIPVKAALEMLGPDRVRRPAAADGRPPTRSSAAAVRTALERAGNPGSGAR